MMENNNTNNVEVVIPFIEGDRYRAKQRCNSK